jgi:ABC-2 type transport system permease protein
MISSIALHEFRRMMLSPLAWVILALIQFLTALQFLNSVEDFMLNQPRLVGLENPPGVSDWIVAPLFADVAFMLLMVIPVISMRSLSAERRDKTLSLLMSSPVSMTEIVLGKYAGILLFLAIMVCMVSLMPLSLMLGTSLDTGKLITGSLGLFLMLSAFAAASLFISSLTQSPAVAAVASFFLLFALWLMFWISSGGEQFKGIVEYISLLHHFVPLLKGSINSADVAYFLLFALTFLILTIRRLDAQRLQA